MFACLRVYEYTWETECVGVEPTLQKAKEFVEAHPDATPQHNWEGDAGRWTYAEDDGDSGGFIVHEIPNTQNVLLTRVNNAIVTHWPSGIA